MTGETHRGERMKEKQEEPEEDTEEDEEKTIGMIDKANLVADRQETANKELKKLLDRQEALAVERTLEGKAEAGTQEEKKEETPSEYAKRVIANE